MTARIQQGIRSGQNTMICSPVSRILRNSGLRKTVFQVQMLYISFHIEKYGGAVLYAERTGELQLIVGSFKEPGVLCVQRTIGIYFLINNKEASHLHKVTERPLLKLYLIF